MDHVHGQQIVMVVPYRAEWPKVFRSRADELAEVMGANLTAIHHIGSTAIPGADAKPIIDILPVVRDLALLDRRHASMRSLGYEALGEFGIAGRRFFRRDSPAGQRTEHVHAFQDGSPHILRHLAFRDYLRAHREIADRYCELKRKLAERHPDDIHAYMDGKDAFIKQVQAAALDWIGGENR